MDKALDVTPKRPLLDRAYWLSRPIEERLAAVQPHPGKARSRDRVSNTGLLSLVALLNSTEIEYLVIGAYAMAAYGAPRLTHELDIWIEPSRDNIFFLLQALSSFGFGSLDLTESHLAAPDAAVQYSQLGHPPPRIDLLTAMDGVRFADCYPRRELMVSSGVVLPFIELEDWRSNKRATGRRRDLADLETLDEAATA